MKKTNQQSSQTEDARLLTSFVSNRDERSFARLVSKYERLVWNVCCRVLKNRSDVEDAFQNTFVLLATKAKTIRKPHSLASWIYGTAYRTATTIRRQHQRYNVQSVDSLDESSTCDVLEQVAQKYENEKVCEELMRMSDKFRAPLVMFYFVGQTSNQIASAMGLSVAAVESRLKRGRLALKSKLLQRGIGAVSLVACLASCQTSSASPALIEQATTFSMAASGGSVSSLSQWLGPVSNTGVKLMITKCALALGITCMIGMGIAMHSAPATESTSVDLSQADKAADSVSVSVQEDDEESSSNMIHRMLVHFHEVFDLFHGHDIELDDGGNGNEFEFEDESTSVEFSFFVPLFGQKNDFIGDEFIDD